MRTRSITAMLSAIVLTALLHTGARAAEYDVATGFVCTTEHAINTFASEVNRTKSITAGLFAVNAPDDGVNACAFIQVAFKDEQKLREIPMYNGRANVTKLVAVAISINGEPFQPVSPIELFMLVRNTDKDV